MNVKVSEAKGQVLDYLVAQAMGKTIYRSKSGRWMTANYGDFNPRHGAPWFVPSTDWAQGWPIIERERLLIQPELGKEGAGNAWYCVAITPHDAYGATPLVAAMRCYVASKMGDEIEVPEDLLQVA